MTFTPDNTPYTIENGTGQNVLDQLNEVFGKVIANNSGTEPVTKVAYMLWADTASTPNVMKMRDSSNSSWITLFKLDGSYTLLDGSNSSPSLSFTDNQNTGIFSSAANTLDISCGGTTRGSFSSSGLAVTGNVSGTTFVGNIDAVDGDFDGTLEADAITVGGVALNTVIAGVTVTNATNATNATNSTHISVADNENTNENNLIPFIEDASATGNVGLESDGDFHYNPSTGTVTATNFAGTFAGDGSGLTGLPPGSDTYNTDLKFTDGTKALFGGGFDLEIFHDGSNSRIADVGTGSLLIQSNGTDVQINKGTTENMAIFTPDQGVKLYYDNVETFQTISGGIGVTGNVEASGNVDLPDSAGSTEGRVLLGTDDDLKIYHTGSNAIINNDTGDLSIQSNGNLRLEKKDGGSDYINCIADGAVEVNHNGTPRLTTTNTGVSVTGNIVVPSGNGIDFSATADGTGSNQNELLDDYEEGLWTPVLRFGGSTSGITYSSIRGGSYTKIGRQVTVHFGFNLTDKGSASGDASIAGLPFNPISSIAGTSIEANGISGFWNTVNGTTNISNIVFIAHDSNDVLDIRFTSGPQDQTNNMTNTHFEDATELRGTITYNAAT